MIELNATFFAQILNFLILVVILRAVAYKPVVRMLKAREDRIQESLDKADADAVEADKMLAEYKAKLAAANAKAETIVRNAEKRASEEREEKRAEAKREIEQMKKAAQAEIQRDRERAADQLKKEIVALSLLAAGKVVEKNMEDSENEALVGDFIDKLDKDKIGDLSC